MNICRPKVNKPLQEISKYTKMRWLLGIVTEPTRKRHLRAVPSPPWFSFNQMWSNRLPLITVSPSPFSRKPTKSWSHSDYFSALQLSCVALSIAQSFAASKSVSATCLFHVVIVLLIFDHLPAQSNAICVKRVICRIFYQCHVAQNKEREFI